MGVAAWWGQQLATGADPLTLDQALAEIDAVTPEDIQQLAQALWRPEKLSLAYVGPLASEDDLVAWLKNRVS
jgi:predicted Zn-dependent peptidase